MSHRVLVDDNYHYMDESQRWTQGEYATYAEALSVSKRIVEESLKEGYKPGITAAAILGQFVFRPIAAVASPVPDDFFDQFNRHGFLQVTDRFQNTKALPRHPIRPQSDLPQCLGVLYCNLLLLAYLLEP